MLDLIDQLEAEIRDYVLAEMPGDGSGELAAEPLAGLLITYATWRGRLITAQPRTCHQSSQLQASTEAEEHKASLDAIAAKIEAGDDLTPHLSRAVKTAHEAVPASTRLNRRRDRDLLIADWGIHHLHLSDRTEGDGFVERGDDLLFAVFTATDAYLIGIYPHGSWGLTEMLEILVRNWPEAHLMPQLHGIVGLTQKYTDAELLQLRNAGVASPMVEVDGKVYMAPALGQTTAGTPGTATRQSNLVMHTLRDWREHLDDRLADAADAVDATAGHSVSDEWIAAVREDVAALKRGEFLVPVAQLA